MCVAAALMRARTAGASAATATATSSAARRAIPLLKFLLDFAVPPQLILLLHAVDRLHLSENEGQGALVHVGFHFPAERGEPSDAAPHLRSIFRIHGMP